MDAILSLASCSLSPAPIAAAGYLRVSVSVGSVALVELAVLLSERGVRLDQGSPCLIDTESQRSLCASRPEERPARISGRHPHLKSCPADPLQHRLHIAA
jgi:hypothetical protein